MVDAKHRFWDRPEVDKHRVALVDGVTGTHWTFGDLSSAVASQAKELELAEKALVFCLCRNDLSTVVAYLASLDAGHSVLLLDMGWDDTVIEKLIDAYRPEILLRPKRVEGDDAEALASEVVRRDVASYRPIHPDLALLLSTSGSTGSPKLVRLSYRNVAANAASIAQGLAIDPEERAITSLPLHYSYGLSVLNSHLYAGASVTLTDEGLMSADFWQLFREHRCTSFAGVPYSYQILDRLDMQEMELPTLSVMTQAGGRLPNELVAKYSDIMRRRGGRFFVMYGQTEATARISIMPPDRLPEKIGSVGIAVSGGRVEIEVPTASRWGEDQSRGEVVYVGPNVMMGYATERGDLEQGDGLQGRLHTGDIGYLDEDGMLVVTGRSKRIAKIYGLRINLDEAEALASRFGRCSVVGRGEQLVIFCEQGDESKFDDYAKEMARLLKVNYRAFDFRKIDRLPLTGNGKVDYQDLVERT